VLPVVQAATVVQQVAMVVQVDMQAQLAALLGMAALAALALGKTAQLAVWVVVAVQGVVVSPMLAADRVSTFRRPPTNMLGMVGTSMWQGQGETSHASSRVAVF